MSSAGEKRSAEEADIEIVEYDGPESLRGVEIVPTDSVERLFTWKNCMSVNGVHLKNKWEHPELLELEEDVKKGKAEVETLHEADALLYDQEGSFMDNASEYSKEIFMSAKKRIKAHIEDKNRDILEKQQKINTFPMIATIKLLNDQFKLGVKHI